MKLTMYQTIGTSVGASAGAIAGMGVGDYAPAAILALLGAGTALMIRPPEGTKAMFGRFWGGSFFGFLLGPNLSQVERFSWLSSDRGLPLDIGPAVAAFFLFFLLQITAEILSSPKAVPAFWDWIARKAKGGK